MILLANLHAFIPRSTVLIITLLISINVLPATITSFITGNWSAPGTWNNNNVTATVRTGTITAATNTITVTGINTLFTTELSVGNSIRNNSGTVIGTVATIVSNTQLTLGANAGSAVANAAYRSSGVGPSDDVVIAPGLTITMNGNYACASLTFNGGVTPAILTHSGTSALAVAGGVTLNQPTLAATTAWNINAGSSTVGGSIAFAGTNNTVTFIASINLTTGSLGVAGSFTFATSAAATKVINITNTGTLTIGGNFPTASSTFNAGTTSTVHYNGSSAQSVRSGTYSGLTFSNAGVKTLSGNIVIGAGRTLLINSTAIVDAGLSQVTAGGATATITIAGTLRTADLDGLCGLATTTIHSTNTTITPFVSTTTIDYNATTGTLAIPQFVSAVGIDSIYSNIILSGGGVKQANANFYMLAGSVFTLDAGVSFFMGTRNVKRQGTSGTVTFNINGTFITTLSAGFSGGNTAINGTGTAINLGSTSVIQYARTGTQTISARADYVVLRVKGTSGTATTNTMDGSVTVSDSLSIVEGEVAINGHTLTLNGKIGGNLQGSATSNLVVGGTTTAAVLSFVQTSTATATLNNLTINRAAGASLSTALNIDGTLNTNTGPVIINAQTLTLNGTVTYGTGAITGGATSNLSIGGTGNFGTLTLTAGAQSLNNFTINRTSSGNVNLGHNLAVSGVTTISNGTLSIGSNTFTINGTLSGLSASGSFSSNGSSNLVVNGSGALGSSLFFDQSVSGTTNSLATLTYNRASQTITLGNALQITGTVTPTAGTLATGGNLTLISNASGTGRIAAGTGAYILGNVTAQRFIPAVARRWRFLSSPMSNATLEDWRNETYLTGPGTGNTIGSLNSNGFDATQNNKYSVYTYNESTPGVADLGWTGVGNASSSLTTASLTAGRGYRVFIRGDRTDLNRLRDIEPTQNAVTLDLTGTVNTGDIVIPVSNSGVSTNDGWCLVGNPYPSQYDWNAFWDLGNSGGVNGTNYTNINPTIHVYNPVSNGYLSYNASSNFGNLTGGIVAQGQSFFIQTAGASPAMTFKEQFKTATSPVALFKNDVKPDEMKITLVKDSLNFDEFMLKFMDGSVKEYDGYDILKMSASVNISSYTSQKLYLTGDARPLADADIDTVYMSVSAQAGDLGLYFNYLPANNRYYYLFDSYLDTLVLLSAASQYVFHLNTEDAETFGDTRFMILISKRLLDDNGSTGIKNARVSRSVARVWPNPAKKFINISVDDQVKVSTVSVFTMSGKQVLLNVSAHYSNEPVSIDVSGIAPGIYLLQLDYGNNGKEILKITIE